MKPAPLWEDASLPLGVRAKALLDALDDRGDPKALGAWLDKHGDVDLRGAIVEEGERRGADLDEDTSEWPGKKLLRRALGREAAAHAVGNPTHRDEGFVCTHCARTVPPNGRVPRNHCPSCLRSLHVDVVPGDRAATCKGRMDPVGARISGDRVTLLHRCSRCGAERVNKVVRTGEAPDDWAAIVLVSKGTLP